MAFCANCGSDVQGKFCAKCGAAVAGAPPQAGPAGNPYTPPTPGFQGPPPSAQAGLEENVACALCYLFGVLTGVLFLVLEPYNKNKTVRFHAFQSIFVWLAMVIVWVLLLVIVPVFGFIIFTIFQLGVLVLWLMLMYKAYNRERWVLPIIGPMAEKQA
jgi:uncharacterized membrane protein